MRAFVLKVFAVAVWAWAACTWLITVGTVAFAPQKHLVPPLFFYLGIGYFLALIWAVFTRRWPRFRFCCVTAQTLLAVEIGYVCWIAHQEMLRNSPDEQTAKIFALITLFYLLLLSFIYLLPSLVWFLLWADWRQRDFLPVTKAFAVIAAVFGVILWAAAGPGAGLLDPHTPLISRLGLSLPPVYFAVLIWAAFTRQRKRFCLGLLAAALILVIEVIFIFGMDLYAASHASFADDLLSRLLPFVFTLGLLFIMFYAIFFLSFWAWGLLCVRWLAPSWFIKKVDVSPKLS